MDVVDDMDRRDRNHEHRYWRQDRRHVRFTSYDAWDPHGRRTAATSRSAEDEFTAREERRRADELTESLHKAIETLPSSQRDLVLALLAGFTQQEIAQSRGTSPAAISRQKARAISNLRQQLTHITEGEHAPQTQDTCTDAR